MTSLCCVSIDTGVVYLLSNYLETGVGVGAMLCHSGMCRSRGLAALVAVTGEKAVVERHKVDTRYSGFVRFLLCMYTYKERECKKIYLLYRQNVPMIFTTKFCG